MPLPENIKELIKNAQQSGFLSLSNAGIMDEDIGPLVELLNQASYVQQLDLKVNNIGDEGGAKLATLQYVKSLDLNRNNINESAVNLVAADFIQLDLSGNNIKQGQGVVQAIKPSLKILNLKQNLIQPEFLTEIQQKLQTNNDPVSLDTTFHCIF